MNSLPISLMQYYFGGEQVISPDELEDADTEESSILEHREYAESIKASRDSIKICKKSLTHGVELVMLGIESQEHIHYAMRCGLWVMITAHTKNSMTAMQRNTRKKRV